MQTKEPTTPQALRSPTQPLSLQTARDRTLQSIIIGRPASEVYAFWRKLENLPSFMKGLESVDLLSERRSRWTVALESGKTVTWEAEITSEEPGRSLSWQSVEGSDVKTTGSITFSNPIGKKGALVELSLRYTLPGGKPAELLLKLAGEDPESLAIVNLKRLKAFLETGEIPTTEGQPNGHEAGAERVESQPTLH